MAKTVIDAGAQVMRCLGCKAEWPLADGAFKTTLGSQTGDFWEQGNTTGKPKKSASMFVTSRSKPVVHNQGTAMTVTLRITGTITESTVS